MWDVHLPNVRENAGRPFEAEFADMLGARPGQPRRTAQH